MADVPEKIRIVCATRVSAQSFMTGTLLGRSLRLFQHFPVLELQLFADNTEGLPALYNFAIEESRARPATLMFIHDDILLCDFFWIEKIRHALRVFDIVGLAGNKRRIPKQPSWYFLDDRFTRDSHENLSGVVAHGESFPPESLSIYGPPYQEVKLLDGLMLVARSAVLIEKDIRFDERFDFHFYDLDFCRRAEQQQAKMGTWAISVVHQSGGNFNSEPWRGAYAKYLQKWGS
jgi:hypothetical protein